MAKGKFEKSAAEKRREEQASACGEKKKRKLVLWQKILLIALAVILVLVIAVVWAANHVLGKLGSFDDLEETNPNETIVEEFDTDSTIDGQETIETINAGDVTFGEVEVLESKEIVNIMLIGQDARPGEGRSRSDSMILVTLNPKKNAIQMTSFMRDTYVQIPGYMDNRLNVAYRYGGTELMNETFKKNFGLQIDGNVMVDFKEFAHIIDILGGVEIELNAEEVQYLRNNGFAVQQGKNHLDGETALDYSRMRYVSGGDYGRTERQRKVLSSVINSLRGQGLTGILKLVDEVLPSVVTNVSKTDIIKYVTEGVSLLANQAEIQSLRIPADDAHYGAMIDGMSVMVADMAMCREDLNEFIYEE